jgi:hypothetical protein
MEFRTCSNLEAFAKVAAEREWIMKTISKEQWSATDIDLARGADEEMKQVFQS